MKQSSPADIKSRREFLTKTLTVGALAGTLSLARGAHAGFSDDTIKIGLIGCGGRGCGAVINALRSDSNIKLVALGDLFSDRLQNGLENISNEFKDKTNEKIDVSAERQFVGFQAYQQVIDSGVDAVLLATPPHFRPQHLKAAVLAGKHCFVEKPVAVDAPGVRSVLETCEAAKQKRLSIVSGLCYRYDLAKRALFTKVHEGAIGAIQTMEVNYLTNTLKYFDRQSHWSDMEWQLRNWQYFTWLSGDHNVEQHVHSLDKAAWAMHDEPPIKCVGLGGRQMRDPHIGNTYDHFAVTYEYQSGQRLFARCRQMDGCKIDVSDILVGTHGTAEVMKNKITGSNPWQWREKAPNMYQQEHDEFFASIRGGTPINDGVFMCRSTLMGLMGRMSAYTGQEITWDQALNSQEVLTLDKYEWGEAPEVSVAKPGITKFL